LLKRFSININYQLPTNIDSIKVIKKTNHHIPVVLSASELRKLKYMYINDMNSIHSVKNTRNMYIFSCLVGGLRQSDVISLRWCEIKQGINKDDKSLFIEKNAMKTKKKLLLKIDNSILYLLVDSVLKTLDIPEQKSELGIRLHKLCKLDIIALKAQSKKLKELQKEYSTIIISSLENRLKKDTKNELKNIINQIDTITNKMCEYFFNLFSNLRKMGLLNDGYVFNELPYEALTCDAKRFDVLLSSSRRRYARHIDNISLQLKELTGNYKRMTTHTPRHTYSAMMILSGCSVFELQKVLGHTSSDMTDKYIKTLNIDLSKINNTTLDYIFNSNYDDTLKE